MNDEALEDNEFDDLGDDMRENSEEPVEGEDLLEDLEKDYEHRPELDRYEHEGLDDDSH